jgi:2-succinyl-6-hydroxy-2,4-cyclohexadiene-1-carboxylate synthase
MGQGNQKSLWVGLASLSVPLLVVAGERDTKYVGIARRIAALLSGAALEVVPDAGHDIVGENQATLAAMLVRFWSDIEH